jgi:hypothetical protein
LNTDLKSRKAPSLAARLRAARRTLALLALGAFIGFGVARFFHELVPAHAERGCAVCHLAHQSVAAPPPAPPAAAPAPTYARLPTVRRHCDAVELSLARPGRGPPAAV